MGGYNLCFLFICNCFELKLSHLRLFKQSVIYLKSALAQIKSAVNKDGQNDLEVYR